MVNVLASIRLKKGMRADFLEIFKALMPTVHAEEGCIDYFPAVDIDAELPVQALDEDTVTIIEKWQSLEALQAHLATAHMLHYRQQVQDLVEEVSLKVLQEA